MSPSGSSGSTTSSGRILAVDDQAANLRVVGILLGRNGYEVVPAANGAEALAAAQAHTPDLILLDMMMPGMDGFELLAALRALPALRGVPAVFLTAAHDRDLLLRAFDAGAVDYVTKPFMPEELLARVGAHVGLNEAAALGHALLRGQLVGIADAGGAEVDAGHVDAAAGKLDRIQPRSTGDVQQPRAGPQVEPLPQPIDLA